ncbi:unnamed protein product [Colias eurytheme]|nr:unnamed protein product [Colias eurytheme]
MEDQFVTIRKNRTTNMNHSIISNQSTDSDYLARSLPDLSTYNENCDGKEQIEDLKSQLEAAHLEIENILLENSSLKKIIVEQKAAISRFKKICSTDFKIVGSTSSTRKKPQKTRQEKNVFRQQKLNMSCNDLQLYENNTNNDGISTKINFEPPDNSTSMRRNSQPQHKPSQSKPNNVPEILLIGSQQCKGLTLELIHSRYGTKYGKFYINSWIKPYAKTVSLLNSLDSFHDLPENYLVLCVGENDTNPYENTLNNDNYNIPNVTHKNTNSEQRDNPAVDIKTSSTITAA